ncbi:MAG: MinD/ParA family protein [Candidatus Desantisbacteria bacterium]
MADQAEKLRELVRQKQQIAAQDDSKCKIITVTSGKGGVGKTNLSSNLAISFSMMGQRVLLMDADLGLSNVNIIMGIIPPPKYNLSHVISGEKDLLEVITHGPCGVKVITGAVGVPKMANMGTKKRNEFIESFDSLLSLFDLIFIDTSAGLSENVLAFIDAADEVILVTTPEPTSITDAYGMIKAMSAKNGNVKVGLVVNRIQNIIEGKKVSDKIVNIAEQFLGLKIERLGYIMEDALVRKSVHEQSPFLITYPDSKAASCISHIRNKLADMEEENHKEKGFFGRMFQGLRP